MGCPSLPAAAAAIAAAAAEATAGDGPRETEEASRRRIITDCGGATDRRSLERDRQIGRKSNHRPCCSSISSQHRGFLVTGHLSPGHLLPEDRLAFGRGADIRG